MPDRKLKVYYNSACPVCNAGITLQKKRMTRCAVEWRDVHTDVGARADLAADLEFVRERLHAVDEHGAVKVGAEAIEILWRHSPGERWKAWIVGRPVINPVFVWAYNAFARRLYKWNRKRKHW